MRADLHLHTVFSDGACTPAEIARMAKEAGLAAFSITDHDSMEGSEEGALAARTEGIHYVRGWEVSSYDGACKVHILGYGCKMGDAYHEFLRRRFEGARIRAADMLNKANAFFGTHVTIDDVEAYHARKNTPLHTMHVVTAFAERLSRNKGDLYREVFARGGPAFSEACRPTPLDAIGVIHATGGIAVLAHPGRILDLTEEELVRYRTTQDAIERDAFKAKSAKTRVALMERMVLAGLDGIECFYTTHTAIETEEFLSFAKAHGLLVTGGSDFHAAGARNVLGLPVFDMGDELAERLLRLDGSV